jgi:vaccinia related kinase
LERILLIKVVLGNAPFPSLNLYVHVFALVSSWADKEKIKYLGVPKYIAHGNHKRGSEEFRFLVMPRFGTDLQKIFEGCGKQFSKETVLALGLRMV